MAQRKEKYESETEFIDRTLWAVAARLARDVVSHPRPLYLYYRPSTPDDWGAIGVLESDPGAGGFVLAWNESIPRSASVDSVRNLIYRILRKLPILPTTPEALERGIR